MGVHLVLLVLALLALLAVVLLLRNSCPTWPEASSTVSATTSVALSTTTRLAKLGGHQLSLTHKMFIKLQADLPREKRESEDAGPTCLWCSVVCVAKHK